MSGFEHWKAAVVRSLADSKRRGLSFEWAWRRAMHEHPARLMECGPRTPSFDDELPTVEFYRDACRAAWNREASALVDLPAALESFGDRPALKRRGRGSLV
jgi:hypothetical protein